ncbi:MAG TPA: hypothetical protein DHN33_00255, partial [Eubacteriaceae bacterium]|nr:hypothetical protein [Eubacteriaceae bacterium]
MNRLSLERTELLIGQEGIHRLEQSSVAVFGIGGVGGFAAEALARSGVGRLVFIDHDTISPSNINRQIHSDTTTVGRYKVDVMKERVEKINPDIQVQSIREFFLPDQPSTFDFGQVDYIVDAVDTVTAKIELIVQAKERKIPIISAMGAGNKLDPTQLELEDIYRTSVCPLAKVMRKELKARGIKNLTVVYSKEPPIQPVFQEGEKKVPGS